MKPAVRLLVMLAITVLAAPLPPAAAQGGGGRMARMNRPSEQTGSSVLGGQYTRNSVFRTLDSTSRQVSLLGADKFQYMRGRNRSGGDRPNVMPASQFGLYNNLAEPGGLPLSWAADRTGEVSALSGLQGAPGFYTALPGYRAQEVPAMNAFLYTPRTKSTPFDNFFGLTPTPPELQPGAPTIKSVAAQMEVQTEKRVRQAERDGLDLFKRATVERLDYRTRRYPNCRDCAANLDQAIRLFTMVRDLDKEAYLPTLLMAHAALEEERPIMASVYLLDAFRRNPGLFSADPGSISQYFGDVAEGSNRSTVLEAQMRQYVRTGELNPESPEGQLLSAYCGWRIGDTERAREAARLAAELAPAAGEPDLVARMANFAAAVRAALP